MSGITERGNAQDSTGAGVVKSAELQEHMPAPSFTFGFECMGPREQDRSRYVYLRDMIAGLVQRSLLRRLIDWLLGRGMGELLAAFRAEIAAIQLERKWAESIRNTVMTGGKNDLLDKYFAGSSYTAAWYVLPISSVSYSAIAAGDTMSSHAGWTEAGPTNAPNYSQSTRVALAFSAASSGSKATSAASALSITATGTIKGAAVVSNSTKDGTTGILYSAALFTGGDKVVASGDTLNITGSWSV